MSERTDTKETIAASAKKVKIIILDVDGVLTDGSIVFGHDGEAFKRFNARDGMGIGLAHEAGIKTAIITGRKSLMVNSGGEELKIGDIYQGVHNKMTALREIIDKHGLTFDQAAYIGDDVNDLPALTVVGLPCAVADAVGEVKAKAKLIAQHPGGCGAVREVIEYILKAQNKWDDLITAYLNQAQ